MFYEPSFPSFLSSLFFLPFSQPITTERNQSQSETTVKMESSYVIFSPFIFICIVFSVRFNSSLQKWVSKSLENSTGVKRPHRYRPGRPSRDPQVPFFSIASSEKSSRTSRPTCISRAQPYWPLKRPTRLICTMLCQRTSNWPAVSVKALKSDLSEPKRFFSGPLIVNKKIYSLTKNIWILLLHFFFLSHEKYLFTLLG